MKLWEYDLYLYALLRRCLSEDGFVSPAAHVPDAAMRAGMLAALETIEVGDRCSCGTTFCRTFGTRLTPARDAQLFKVRFHVAGELLVTCDRAGAIYRVEWLVDETARTATVTRYESGIGWTKVKLADDLSQP